MRSRAVFYLLPLLLCLAVGCQRVRIEKSYKMEAQAVQLLGVDPPAYQQQVKVTVEPVSAGVKAYLVKEVDEKIAQDALGSEKEPRADIVLGSGGSEQARPFSFEATIPAKTGYTVLLKTATKGTDVKVTIVGK